MSRQETDRQANRLPGPRQEGERRPGLRAIGGTASRITAPIVQRHGGGVLARLKAEWSAIAGADLAALTWPEALGRDGALKLRVVPRFALELQHRAPLVIERVNNFFGRAAVARLVLRQGPLPLAGPAPPPAAPPLPVDQARALDTRLAGIADPELRRALAGLGSLVLRRSGRAR
jgi:hypothetical protein